MTLDFNMFNLACHPIDPSNEPLDVNTIQDTSNEHPEDDFFYELNNLVAKSLFSSELDESSNYVPSACMELPLELLTTESRIHLHPSNVHPRLR